MSIHSPSPSSFMAYDGRSWTSGAATYARYKALIDKKHIPFIRASLSERVVESALNWSAGQLRLWLFGRSTDYVDLI